MTHTPGPWSAIKFNDTKSWTIQANIGRSLASVKTGEADARLIAAAPDMLEALQAARRHAQLIRLAPERRYVIEQLDAAITKATAD